jgi:hypothetical protein
MSNEKSFIHKNKNIIIAFLVIAFLLILLIFYNTTGGGRLLPEGNTQVAGSEVGLIIGDPVRDQIEQQETTIYKEQIIDKSHNYGLFETKLNSLGFFEYNGKKEFRIDIWVHNVGEGTEEFLWDKANIIGPDLKKYMVTSAKFDGAEIPSDGEREGYLLFSDVPEGMSGEIAVIVGNSVAFSTILGFTSQAPHRYEGIILK